MHSFFDLTVSLLFFSFPLSFSFPPKLDISVGEEEKGNFGKGFFGGEVEEFGRVGMGIGGMGNGI